MEGGLKASTPTSPVPGQVELRDHWLALLLVTIIGDPRESNRTERRSPTSFSKRQRRNSE